LSFLLDTNLVSEWVKPRPNPGVVAWLSSADEDRTFLSAVTLAELRHGVERLTSGARQRRLDQWLSVELPLRFDGRILLIDPVVADGWGRVMARVRDAGRAIGVMDAFIAATALAHDLTLATRNTDDFDGVVRLVNPWTER
jgi:toxin FitB